MSTKLSRKSKAPDHRPARDRYWSKHRLQQNKVRNLVRSHGMTEDVATKFWLKVRAGRRMRGYKAAAE